MVLNNHLFTFLKIWLCRNHVFFYLKLRFFNFFLVIKITLLVLGWVFPVFTWNYTYIFLNTVAKVFIKGKGNNIIMISKIYYSPVYCGVSKQLNLLDFNFKNSNIQCLKRFSNKNSGLKENKLVEFIERTYYYVKVAISKYI